jgi:transcriptional regulatory protein LevR
LLVELGESKITYLNHSVLYFVGSKDPEFNQVVFRNMENVINKSSLMSGSGEKERTQVFNTLRKKVYLKLEEIDLSPKN